MPVNFGGLFGMPTKTISADASTTIAYANYEIALALDMTGSMTGGKLTAMKDAVNGLIDTMSAQNPRPDSLKFSLVPFSSKVNVGPQFGPAYNFLGAVTRQPASWLDAPARSPIAQNDLDPGVSRFVMMKQLRTSWEGCVESRHATAGNPYDVNDTPPNQADPATLFVPAFASDEPDNGSYPNSYMSEARMQSAAARRFSAWPDTERLHCGIQVSGHSPTNHRFGTVVSCADQLQQPVVLRQLSRAEGPEFRLRRAADSAFDFRFQHVRTKVNSLQALGSTNILEGAVWGWKTLSSRPPFTEGGPKTARGTKNSGSFDRWHQQPGPDQQRARLRAFELRLSGGRAAGMAGSEAAVSMP